MKAYVNEYDILEEAVEAGINHGYRQACKHYKEPPPEDALKHEILEAVMTEILQRFETERYRPVDEEEPKP